MQLGAFLDPVADKLHMCELAVFVIARLAAPMSTHASLTILGHEVSSSVRPSRVDAGLERPIQHAGRCPPQS